MYIVGLSFGFHDSSVTLLNGGEILYSSLEERFTRKKHDNAFPINALNAALEYAGISINDIHKIVYYENNLLKLNRILEYSSENALEDVLDYWITNDKINIEDFIADYLKIENNKIISLNHHLSHASSSFYPSGFEESAVVVIDAVGEYDTISIYKGYGTNLEQVYSKQLPNSIGLFYSAFTSFLGFEVNDGEYKVMGMSSYGDPVYIDKILKTINIDQNNGDFNIKNEYFDFLHPEKRLFTDDFIDLFGEPRKPDVDFFMNIKDSSNNDTKLLEENIYHANLAASLQAVTELLIINIIKKATVLTNCQNICMSGGVALNSVANGKVKKQFPNLFIQPEAGDGGSSLGAALYYSHNVLKIDRKFKQTTSLLGNEYKIDDIKPIIEQNLFKEKIETFEEIDLFLDKVSDLLIEKNVIGWFNGRFEWGPRALGSRSIIADPRDTEMKLIINKKIKFREPFRPFAPSALAEYVHEWFDLPKDLDKSSPENYMLTTCDVREDKKEKIPAVTHVDGSARVQIVQEDINTNYYNLIKKFYEKTGVPLIVNTSFNLKGEPIVNTIKDAILTFSYSEMDCIAAYPYIIYKSWND